MFKRKGGGVKGLLNNVKKTALFSYVGFPKTGSEARFGKDFNFRFSQNADFCLRF